MSSAIPPGFYPVMLVQDRYQGSYGGGDWLAIRNADEPEAGKARASWVLEFGPAGGDVEAAEFWASPPEWIAVGVTTDEAIANLIKRA